MGSSQGQLGGAARYGQPGAPVAPDFETDPNKYQSFDRSSQANQAIAQGNAAGANQMALAKARLAATGGGRSSAANKQQMDIAGALGQGAMGIQNQNALQGWQDKMQQMNSANQWNLHKYGLDQSQYKTSADFANAERANRQQLLSQLGPLGNLANLVGGY